MEKREINSRLQDIMVEREDANLKFNAYQEKSVIGNKIYKSFLGMWKKGKGVSLTARDENKYGTISNIMALSSMLEFDAMGIDLSNNIDKLHFLIESVFNSVYQGLNVNFDASPYFVNTENEYIDTYVETASKIFITMIDLRNYAISHHIAEDVWHGSLTLNRKNIQKYVDLASAAEELMIDALRCMTSACLPTRAHEKKDYVINGEKVVRDGFDSVINYRGWSLQRPMGDADSYGVSIYYTYHATNAYVSLYNAYPKILTASFFTTGRLDENEFKNYSESQRKKLDYDLAFLKRAKPDIMEFRGMCSSAGRYFDTIMKEKGIDLSFDYIKNGFGKVSAAQILESQKNNYVMETLFTIAIIMNAGVDEDYEFVGQNDYIYNQILYSLTNIKKIYNLLKRSNKEDLIDSYMLSSALFSEKIPSKYNELVRRFRNSCENVSAYNLVPLLCNTYSTVFAFLIKYPNKEMVDNLELVMENRADGDNWYWDKDGFNINNNLYYIVAIENFYDYYNEYELPYMELGREYNVAAQQAQAELLTKSQDYDSAQNTIKKLQEQLDNKRSDLDAEVYKIAEKVFVNKFEKGVDAYINQMIDDCIKVNIKYSAGDEEIKTLFEQYPKAETLLKMANAENFISLVTFNGADDEEEITNTKKKIERKIKDDLKMKKDHVSKE